MPLNIPVDTPEKSATHSGRASSKGDSIVFYEHLIPDLNVMPLSTTLAVPKTPTPRPTSWFEEPATSLPSNGGFPDGGWAAWLVVSGSWCGQFCSLGWINCMGILQAQYEQDQLQRYFSSTIAWIISLQTFLTFAGAPIFGKIFDNHGARGMMLLGVMMHVLGLMMTSVCTKYWHFILAQSICSGVGSGAIVYASLNSVATWFRERRAVAMGWASSGSGFGGIVTPFLFHHLEPRVGFGWAMRCVAFMFLGLLAWSCITVRSHLKPTPQPWRLADFLQPLKDRRFLSTTLASFVFHLALFLPMNYITLQALDEGISEKLADYLIPILSAGSVLGRVLLGRLGDKTGRFNCLIISASMATLLVLAAWLSSRGSIKLIVFSALYGFSSGAYISLLPACVAQIADIEKVGVYNGLNWVFAATGTLIGNPVGGALIQQQNGGERLYSHMQIFAAVAMGSGIVLYTMARAVQVGLPSKI